MTIVHLTPAHSVAVLAITTSGGSAPVKTSPCGRRRPSLSGWLAATARVTGSANSIGPHNETPHKRPPSRVQTSRASRKYCAASAGSSAGSCPRVAAQSTATLTTAARHNHRPSGGNTLLFALSFIFDYLISLVIEINHPSQRSAISGSTFVALRAGIQQAASATSVSNRAMTATVSGSVTLTP